MRSIESTLDIPVAASACLLGQQRTPGQATPTPQALLSAMAANVSTIVDDAEHLRWQADVDLWRIALTQTAGLPPADLDRMMPLLDRMKRNVAQVTERDESERWQANIDLWAVRLGTKGQPTTGGAAKLKIPLDRLTANVARIQDPGEKTRWAANRGLWQATADRIAAIP